MESDVLELDVPCSDDLNEAPKAAPPMEKDDHENQDEQLAQSRLLWISGIDETMKANDFRVAFEPHGKGMDSGSLFDL